MPTWLPSGSQGQAASIRSLPRVSRLCIVVVCCAFTLYAVFVAGAALMWGRRDSTAELAVAASGELSTLGAGQCQCQPLEPKARAERRMSEAMFAHLGAGAGCSPARPSPHSPPLLFLRGFPKSGTTWLRTVVSHHPAIRMRPWEMRLDVVTAALQRFTGMSGVLVERGLDERVWQWYHSLVRCLMSTGISEHSAWLPPSTQGSASDAKIEWLAEKSPSRLTPLFPNASYIYIVRDGRDVLVSAIFHQLHFGGMDDGSWCNGQARLTRPDDERRYKEDGQYFEQNSHRLLSNEACVRAIARRWRQQLQDDDEAIHAIEQPDSNRFHNRIKVVRYESLLHNTSQVVDSLFTYLGVNSSLAAPLLEEDYSSPGFQTSAPRPSFFRQGKSGSWRSYFHAQARTWFRDEAQDALVKWGYETDDHWAAEAEEGQ
jgi:hypothetical protein